jgi:hypothetical protein
MALKNGETENPPNIFHYHGQKWEVWTALLELHSETLTVITCNLVTNAEL